MSHHAASANKDRGRRGNRALSSESKGSEFRDFGEDHSMADLFDITATPSRGVFDSIRTGCC